MTDPRPPSIPPEIDEYDGHGDYRARIRDVVSFKPLVWAGVLVAFGMWYAVGKLSMVVMDAGPGANGYLPLISYVLFGGVGFFVYLIALAFAKSPHANRAMLAAGALSILFAAFYPFAYGLELERVDGVSVDASASERWLDELREQGNVGRPGVVPPFLAVQERGDALLVRNASGRPLSLQLARVSEERGPDGLPTWQRCRLFNGGGGHSDRDNRYWLPPHASACCPMRSQWTGGLPRGTRALPARVVAPPPRRPPSRRRAHATL